MSSPVKTFVILFVPLAMLFIVSVVTWDWARSRFASQPDDIFEQQDEMAEELFVIIQAEPDISADELAQRLPEQWQERFPVLSLQQVVGSDVGLTNEDMAMLFEQGWLIFDFPELFQWQIYIRSGNNEEVASQGRVTEIILDNTSSGYDELNWLLGFSVLYLLALAMLVTGAVALLQQWFGKVDVSLDNILNKLSCGESVTKMNSSGGGILMDSGLMDGTLMDRIQHKTQFIEQAVSDTDQHQAQHYDELRDLLHGVAHEFRSPMARLSFALDMVENENVNETSGVLLKDMGTALEELDALVKEVLSYSRLEHGSADLKLESLSLSGVVQEIISKQQKLYPAIQFENKTGDLNITVDHQLFSRAAINLIRNAARFAETRVCIDATLSGGRFVFSVDDDGPGIPPGKRERIFEPFTRLDPSRSRDSGGAGLGLAIVASITALHNGEVEVEDSDLGGARFILKYPHPEPD